ncbi:outer membrane beta-barrel protein [Saccharicrinis aurantiacus]|uniref:outer membrane beta-barrel protein n=1 Tax=Saccharicrinis aurantiacus TaxID=1849719 RepID=UPI002491593D|nr:hypothetical protein [Saccharicrinis aurantiacus]
MIKQISCAILLCITSLTMAQSDFVKGSVITLNGDTLYGEVNLRSNIKNSESCIFRDTNTTHTYLPNDIKAYTASTDKYYISKTVKLNADSANFFLEVLVQGDASLYYLKHSGDDLFFIDQEGRLTLLSNKETIIEKDDGTKYSKESKQYIGALLYTFRDAPKLTSQIKNTEFYYKSLVNITNKYNQFKNPNTQNYSKTTKNKVYLETGAGYTGITYNINSLDTDLSLGSATVGVDFVFKPLKAHYVWDVTLGLYAVKYKGDSKIEYNSYSDDSYHLVSIDYTAIKTPIKVRYSLPMKKFQPFINAGIINSIALNNNSTLVNHRSEYTQNEKDASISKYQLFYTFGAGLKWHTQNKNYFNLSANYEIKSQSLVSVSELDYGKINNLVFTISYCFKL